MAPRSLRIMQDRCDSLASCIVPSSLEGVRDPCPLTEKYLEAHYLCHSPLHGPYTTGGSGEIDKSLCWRLSKICCLPTSLITESTTMTSSTGPPLPPWLTTRPP